MATQFRVAREASVRPTHEEYLLRFGEARSRFEASGGNKPYAAFWTLTYTPDAKHPSAGVRYCVQRKMAKWVRGRRVLLYPGENARVFVIRSFREAAELRRRHAGKLEAGMDAYARERGGPPLGHRTADVDWLAVSERYDGVRITATGGRVTRYPEATDLRFYGWDYESTAWFRDGLERVEVLPSRSNLG